jgi:hypothetical protein
MLDTPEFYEEYLEEPEGFSEDELEEMEELVSNMKDNYDSAIRMFREGELFSYLKELADAKVRSYDISLANTLEKRGITEEMKLTDPKRYAEEKSWAEQQLREVFMYG